ncbi:hypothetical protein D3C81_1310240 [compost metagenome]
MLVVEVFQVAVVVLRGQVLAQLVVAAGEVELVGVGLNTVDRCGAGDAQADVVGGVAGLGVLQLAGGQGQAIDLVADDLPAFEQLRQQAAVVEGHHRQLGLQGAEAGFGLRQLDLGGQPGLAVLVHGLPVAFRGEQLARLALVGSVAVTAAVQAHAEQADGIHAEADGAFGEAGLVVEDEALAPLLGGGAVLIADVAVDVEVAQGEVGLAVFEEGGLGRAGQGGGQGGGEHGEGQGGLVHCVFLHEIDGVCDWDAPGVSERAIPPRRKMTVCCSLMSVAKVLET